MMYLNSIRLSADAQQRVELVVDLGLAAGAHLVVTALELRGPALVRLVIIVERRSL